MFQLPIGAKLHDVFHVSLLKQFKAESPVETPVLLQICHDRAVQSQSRCDAVGWHEGVEKYSCTGKGNQLPKQRGLTWKNLRSSTPITSSRTSCWGGGGRDVMLGRQYSRRRRGKQSTEGGSGN
jgi:hypothetical protein